MRPQSNFPEPNVLGILRTIGRSLSDSIGAAGKAIADNGFGAGSQGATKDRLKRKKMSPELAEERAKQSRRIQLQIMAREARYLEIAEIAANATEEAEINLAVLGLFDPDQGEATPEQIHLMERLAFSYSKAACKCLFRMFYFIDEERARDIFYARMNEQHWQYMVKNGVASAYDVVLFSSRLDLKFGTEFAEPHFMNIWQALAGREVEQFVLLGEMLGDTEPLGVRYDHDETMVSPAVKRKAVNLALQLPPDQMERLLVYASQESDDTVSLIATQILMQYWSTAQGARPPKLEPFSLLNLNMNFHLSHMAASFSWKDTTPAAAEYGAAGESAEFYYDELGRLGEELSVATQRMDQSAIYQLKREFELMQMKIKKLSERRLNSLQSLINGICASMDIPNAVVLPSESEHFLAAYSLGRGKVKVGGKLLLSDKPLSEELMSTLLHELLHMEQDALVIRHICDQLGVIFGQHSKKLKDLMSRYADSIGYAPDPVFLLAILRMRDDRPLSAEQSRRAARLLQANYDTTDFNEQGRVLEGRIDKMEKAQADLEEGKHDAYLLSCLQDERGLRQLFENGHLPDVVLEELDTCKEEVSRIMAEIAESLTDEQKGKLNFHRRDSVDLALTLINRGLSEPFEAVTLRIKYLLHQVITEERRNLRRKLVEVRRAGYHEDEAYYITDRTQVIVKALRKGWYRLQ